MREAALLLHDHKGKEWFTYREVEHLDDSFYRGLFTAMKGSGMLISKPDPEVGVLRYRVSDSMNFK